MGTSLQAARDILEPKYPSLVFGSAGGVVPFQAYGTYLGVFDFYFRFRGDSMSLTIGTPEEIIPKSDFVVRRTNVTGDAYAGYLTTDDFIFWFSDCMDELISEYRLPRE